MAEVRHGGLSTVVSEPLAELLANDEALRAVPIEGAEGFTVGLVVPDRQPMSPILRTLLVLAGEVAV